MENLISRLKIKTKLGTFYSDWEETNPENLTELTTAMTNLFYEPFGSLNIKVDGDTMVLPETLLNESIIVVESVNQKDLPF